MKKDFLTYCGIDQTSGFSKMQDVLGLTYFFQNHLVCEKLSVKKFIDPFSTSIAMKFVLAILLSDNVRISHKKTFHIFVLPSQKKKMTNLFKSMKN